MTPSSLRDRTPTLTVAKLVSLPCPRLSSGGAENGRRDLEAISRFQTAFSVFEKE